MTRTVIIDAGGAGVADTAPQAFDKIKANFALCDTDTAAIAALTASTNASVATINSRFTTDEATLASHTTSIASISTKQSTDEAAITAIQTTIAGVTSARTANEIAAGVVPVSLGYPEGDVRRYGAVGAGEDNTTHINNMLAVCAKSGNVALLAGLRLVSSGAHVHDISRHSLDGQGASINFASMATGGTAWRLTATLPTGTGLSSEHARNMMMRVDLVGNKTGAYVGTGLQVYSASANPAMNGFSFLGVSVEFF